MRPAKLSVEDFRNLTRVEIALAPRLTFLVGDNAQGKTNTLEALAYALTLKPLRAARLVDLIRRDAATASIEVELVGPALPWQISARLDPLGRQVAVNGKPLRDPAKLLGAVAAVTFTPDDLALVKGAPELRRKSIDRFVFQIMPAHLRHVREHRRALRARNLLLRGRDRDRGSLDAFTEMLATAGARVMAGRRRGVETLAAALSARHAQLAPAGGDLVARYAPSVEIVADADEAAIAESLRRALEDRRSRDLERRQTTIGPHLDDVDLTLDGAPARRFASQGQTRSIVLALRLAEVDELCRVRGEGPLLLADDLLSELDDQRASALQETVDRTGACVVATGTRLPRGFSGGAEGVAVYTVQGGQLSPLSPMGGG